MAFAPQHDWQLYEARSCAADAAWLRGMSPGDRFALYEDLFELIAGAQGSQGDRQRVEQWRWDEKIATRRRMLDAYSELDRLRRERTIANNAG